MVAGDPYHTQPSSSLKVHPGSAAVALQADGHVIYDCSSNGIKRFFQTITGCTDSSDDEETPGNTKRTRRRSVDSIFGDSLVPSQIRYLGPLLNMIPNISTPLRLFGNMESERTYPLLDTNFSQRIERVICKFNNLPDHEKMFKQLMPYLGSAHNLGHVFLPRLEPLTDVVHSPFEFWMVIMNHPVVFEFLVFRQDFTKLREKTSGFPKPETVLATFGKPSSRITSMAEWYTAFEQYSSIVNVLFWDDHGSICGGELNSYVSWVRQLFLRNPSFLVSSFLNFDWNWRWHCSKNSGFKFSSNCAERTHLLNLYCGVLNQDSLTSRQFVVYGNSTDLTPPSYSSGRSKTIPPSSPVDTPPEPITRADSKLITKLIIRASQMPFIDYNGKKAQVCWHYNNDTCKRGDDCAFHHLCYVCASKKSIASHSVVSTHKDKLRKPFR